MTDEMFHAATRIMTNRAEQLGVSEDELIHKVNNAELLEKKERMLKQSRWERNKRKTATDAVTGRINRMFDLYQDDPDVIADVGKHGYADTNKGRVKRLAPNNVQAIGSTEKDKRDMTKFRSELNHISDSAIKDMWSNSTYKKDSEKYREIRDKIMNIMISRGVPSYMFDNIDQSNSFANNEIYDKTTNALGITNWTFK